MTTAEWILNCTLLGWVLLRNLGTRPVTRGTYLVPLAVVAVAAGIYLRDVPGDGNDRLLELAGIGAGVVFGLAAAACTRLLRDGSGRLLARAGAAFAVVWVLAIGGRIAFAELATHSWGPAVARFSMGHQITGADAWRAAFVLMALVMVLTRVAATAVAAARSPRTPLAADAAAPATA
ncbi:hypothetical protein [Geodermatophilus sp. URMC 62]|uniref:hypothetical protein n=1 Tax=Geodermatophilus sp. URMC 62 TaxID=3423414 RepID=UPI00406C057D